MEPMPTDEVHFDAKTVRLRFEVQTGYGVASFQGQAGAKALDGVFSNGLGEGEARHLYLPRDARAGDPTKHPCK